LNNFPKEMRARLAARHSPVQKC